MTFPSSPRSARSRRPIFFLVAVLACASSAPMAAQVIGDAGDCQTSRAQAEIDRVGVAMLMWLTDVVSGWAPSSALGGPACIGSAPVDISLVPVIPVADLRGLLVPTYIPSIPINDPWGAPYEYRLNVANPLSAYAIALRSAGADRVFEDTIYTVGATSGPEADLVSYNGSRIRQVPRLDPVSRQRTTVSQITNLGVAVLSWITDTAFAAHRSSNGGPNVDLSLITPLSAADLAAFLTPFYTECVPERDGWGQMLDLRLNEDILGSPVTSIRSAGRDGLFEGDLYDTEIFPADNLDRDLVWSDGQYFQSPSPTRAAIFTDDFESATLWGTWSCGPGF